MKVGIRELVRVDMKSRRGSSFRKESRTVPELYRFRIHADRAASDRDKRKGHGWTLTFMVE